MNECKQLHLMRVVHRYLEFQTLYRNIHLYYYTAEDKTFFFSVLSKTVVILVHIFDGSSVSCFPQRML